MMKQKLLYLLPLFLLSGCGQVTYKNASLPAEERAGLLLKELTLEEKVSLMMDSSKPVERLGIKPYNWWNEALHGVARAGLATVFPQPIGMAASFSPESRVRQKPPQKKECRSRTPSPARPFHPRQSEPSKDA
jgi:beta-glucosidase